MDFETGKSLSDDIKHARSTLHSCLESHPNRSHHPVPTHDLKTCRGLCYLRYRKLGLLASTFSGTGFVLAKLFPGAPDAHWSPPTAVFLSGLGLGLQLGLEVV
eukprot:CAMPEP_0174902626 /NCGR_PEP_ID=MMETSP0167-20121228/38886_1 /TAXON_ID=38298 /ORGANISM="Rhodella maculata, Strain CCMP736" /LENGTH=102 /DNA_ID=CAMNT_0016144705 /DNA_START=172 /DNA_END=476 /DNA_ORIENTATION=-